MATQCTHQGVPMKRHAIRLRAFAVSLIVGLLLRACGTGAEEATPTLPVEQIQTEAVATFSAELTSTALAMPTSTPTDTETSTPAATDAPAFTSTVAATSTGLIPTASCDGLTSVSDVT